MPRLHKYRNRDASYVLTAIRGAIITYQLTPEGERKLTAAGIVSGQQFHRALLLDLYRTGNAYTGGGGVYTVDEISGWLRAAGCEAIEERRLESAPEMVVVLAVRAV